MKKSQVNWKSFCICEVGVIYRQKAPTMRIWLLSLALSPLLIAAPVGNPAAPQLIEEGAFLSRDNWISARCGYEGDFVSDAQMKQTEESHGRVDCFQQSTNAGTLTIDFFDRVDIYGVLGSSRSEISWRFTDADEEIHQVQIGTHYDFLWGVGTRIILHQWNCLTAGIAGSYRWARYDPSYVTWDALNVSASGTHVDWREWQAGLGLSYKIGLLTPYLGGKYSGARAKLGTFSVPIAENGSGNLHMKNRNSFGIFIGCTLTTGCYFMLNVEGQLIDEQGISISADLRF